MADTEKVLNMIKEHDAKYVDFRFTDPRGKWQHLAHHVRTIEDEFFVFDDVRYDSQMNGAMYAIDSEEGPYVSAKQFPDGNTGHRPPIKGGYFPVPPVDSLSDLRAEMLSVMFDMGVQVEKHHHEVA